MKVHSVNKVLYPLKFIQKTDIKKASIQNALILFLTSELLFNLYSIKAFSKYTNDSTL
mgnify:FL=1